MLQPSHRIVAGLLSLAMIVAGQATAQSAAPVAKLDLTKLIGTYYVIARLPARKQKACVANELVLYALGDKQRSLQIVTTCQLKQDDTDSWSSSGRMDKSGAGRIDMRTYLIFSRKYYILAFAPDATWAIAGTPDHKSLWLLSGTRTLPDATLAQLKSTAAARGYDTAKLVTILQHAPLETIYGAPSQAAKTNP